MRRPLRRILRLAPGLFFLGGAFALLANLLVLHSARGRIFTNLASLPENDVGIVLGSAWKLRRGYENPFFTGRIEAAARLYRAGKVKHLLLSGDNHIKGYDEPADMRTALLAAGVPADALTLDDAGFRTLDSMARARTVFGLSRATVITDDFHAPRAIFLGRQWGLDALGFTSRPVRWRWSAKTRLREVLARSWAVLDVYLWHTHPKFTGPRLEIASSL